MQTPFAQARRQRFRGQTQQEDITQQEQGGKLSVSLVASYPLQHLLNLFPETKVRQAHAAAHITRERCVQLQEHPRSLSEVTGFR